MTDHQTIELHAVNLRILNTLLHIIIQEWPHEIGYAQHICRFKSRLLGQEFLKQESEHLALVITATATPIKKSHESLPISTTLGEGLSIIIVRVLYHKNLPASERVSSPLSPLESAV